MRSRRTRRASGRPLKRGVRSHFREIWRREELGVPSLEHRDIRAQADWVVLQASSFDACECACGWRRASTEVGARARAGL